jgi:hypothetical protein
VDLPERTGRHLCGGHGVIAQLFLDYLDVSVAFKEVGGERVAQDPDFVGAVGEIGRAFVPEMSVRTWRVSRSVPLLCPERGNIPAAAPKSAPCDRGTSWHGCEGRGAVSGRHLGVGQAHYQRLQLRILFSCHPRFCRFPAREGRLVEDNPGESTTIPHDEQAAG